MKVRRRVFRNSDGLWIRHNRRYYEVYFHDEGLRGIQASFIVLAHPNAGSRDRTGASSRLLLYSFHEPSRLLGHADTNLCDPAWEVKR